MAQSGLGSKSTTAPAVFGTLTIGLTSLAVTSSVLGLRQLGSFPPLELAVYDQMVLDDRFAVEP